MKSLDIFLRAFENVLGLKPSSFVPVTSNITDKKFPAIKHYTIEVHCPEENKLISKVEENFNSSEMSVMDIEDKVIQKTIENMLKYYGVHL